MVISLGNNLRVCVDKGMVGTGELYCFLLNVCSRLFLWVAVLLTARWSNL